MALNLGFLLKLSNIKGYYKDLAVKDTSTWSRIIIFHYEMPNKQPDDKTAWEVHVHVPATGKEPYFIELKKNTEMFVRGKNLWGTDDFKDATNLANDLIKNKTQRFA